MNAYVRGDVVLILCALSKNVLARFKLGDLYRSNSDKARVIRSIWSNNEPIIVVKVGDFIDHYEASAKEYALILSLGLENLA